MADINLLQNQLKDTTLVSIRRTQAVVVVSSLLLIVVVGGIAALYFLTNQVKTATTQIKSSNTQLQQQITIEQKGVTEAQVYQAQLNNIDTLLKNHILITPLLDELESFTYQKAQFLNFSLDQETGKIHLQGTVQSYQDLGKLLLGLSTSANFKNVKLLSVIPATSNQSGYQFSVDLDADTDIFFSE